MTNNSYDAVPAPLFRDPIYDSPTDPVVIWNRNEKMWWMFYTQRRATDITIGYSSIHGTKIGIASSRNGNKWLYRGTLDNLDFEPGHNTFWAPEVIFANKKYHMYVSYITGIPTDWDYPRDIVHYTSENMWDWKCQGKLKLSSSRVIDACVYEIESGVYKMWYKDEENNCYSYAALSRDLFSWEVIGPEIHDCEHEGPNVFEFGGKKWMITDCWDGLAVYESDDFYNWKRQAENILKNPGVRNWDEDKGNHADILVHNQRAFIFYFSRPHLSGTFEDSEYYLKNRNAIQVAELEMQDGKIICNRNKELSFCLLEPDD